MNMFSHQSNPLRHIRLLILSSSLLVFLAVDGECQMLPKTLILTGNGNVPSYKTGYPPWIHEFHNEKVVEILKDITTVDVSTDLDVLRPDRLQQYDLIISNSLFLTPDEKQLDALYQFVSNGKSYITLHCGILSLLNWDRYEEFIGGIFIGGPSSVPAEFKVATSNTMFWGYDYSFRKEPEHPVSIVTEDFVIKDELYHFQSSTRDFHVIARAENLPVMWWHPVGKGKVMSLTLGHDEEAKNNPGYQDLLTQGVRWLIGMPLIYGEQPKIVSNRHLIYEQFTTLRATSNLNNPEAIRFSVLQNKRPEIFTVESSPEGNVKLKLSGKTGNGQFIVSAMESNGLSSTRAFDISVVNDGTGNISLYHGNTATSSSIENQSGMFDAKNVLDNDPSTRWSSAPTDSAWLMIDLQKQYAIKKIVLEWESSFATAYDITGSQDGKTWNSLASVSNGDGQTDTLEFNPSQVRYIRINNKRRFDSKFGYSLYEVKVYQ